MGWDPDRGVTTSDHGLSQPLLSEPGSDRPQPPEWPDEEDDIDDVCRICDEVMCSGAHDAPTVCAVCGRDSHGALYCGPCERELVPF